MRKRFFLNTRALLILLAAQPLLRSNASLAFDCNWVMAGKAHVEKPAQISLYKSDGTLTEDYNLKVQALKTGDTIQFDEHTLFKINAVLGQGASTRIFDIGGGKALRIPINRSNPRDHRAAVVLLNDIIYSNKSLRIAGIPVIKVDASASQIDRFAVVEAVKVKATLEDLVVYHNGNPENAWGKLNLSPEEQTHAENSFFEFATKLWPVKWIGDFRPDQVAYDGEQWILLDYGNVSTFISSFDSKSNLFGAQTIETEWGSPFKNELVPKDWAKKIARLQRTARKNAEKAGYFIRPKFRNSDAEADFLMNSPYQSPLPDGTEINARRRSSYYDDARAEPEIDRNGKVISPWLRTQLPLKIERHLRDDGKYSLYRVQIEGYGLGFLVIKNKIKESSRGFCTYLEEGMVRKHFAEISRANLKLARGYDYMLFRGAQKK